MFVLSDSLTIMLKMDLRAALYVSVWRTEKQQGSAYEIENVSVAV
jgi:hypothetical protein